MKMFFFYKWYIPFSQFISFCLQIAFLCFFRSNLSNFFQSSLFWLENLGFLLLQAVLICSILQFVFFFYYSYVLFRMHNELIGPSGTNLQAMKIYFCTNDTFRSIYQDSLSYTFSCWSIAYIKPYDCLHSLAV